MTSSDPPPSAALFILAIDKTVIPAPPQALGVLANRASNRRHTWPSGGESHVLHHNLLCRNGKGFSEVNNGHMFPYVPFSTGTKLHPQAAVDKAEITMDTRPKRNCLNYILS